MDLIDVHKPSFLRGLEIGRRLKASPRSRLALTKGRCDTLYQFRNNLGTKRFTNEWVLVDAEDRVSQSMWTDGKRVFKSNGTKQYIWNGEAWQDMVWQGVTSFSGSCVWTDGVNIYLSTSLYKHYVLHGDTWETKAWKGFQEFRGDNIWSDGRNIHIWMGTNRYILHGDTWEPETWAGVDDNELVYGQYVWDYGAGIYYSKASSVQRGLDGDTWKSMDWNGHSPNANWVWTDGSGIYYAPNTGATTGYVLKGDTWVVKAWSGVEIPQGGYVWTDGENIYHSSSKGRYILKQDEEG